MPPEDRGIRDAVHVPVCSVLCMDNFRPGQRICLAGHDNEMAYKVDFLFGQKGVFHGIINPFGGTAKRGTYAWVFIKPGLTQGLRHVWSSEVLDVPEEEEEEEDFRDESCRGCY